MNEREKREQELEKYRPTIYKEIIKGNGTMLKQFIEEHPDYIDFALEWGHVHDAAEHNNVNTLKVFLDSGVHPDCVREPFLGRTPLWYAIDCGAYNAAVCLLDAGADVNKEDITTPIITATTRGDLKMVKILVEYGADIHFTYFHSDREENLNALKWAVEREYHAITRYLHSLGAAMPEEDKGKPLHPPTPTEELLADLSEHFGGNPLKFGISEIVPASVPMMVHVFPPVKGIRKNTIFVTSGLMDYALPVPDGQEIYCFAEYFIEMPGTWPVKDKDLEQKKNFWPIMWLKAIGRYPHEQETYYGNKAVVDAKMIPMLKMPDDKYSSALVERCEYLTLRVTQDGRVVIYYRVTPICGGNAHYVGEKTDSKNRS